jgi:hypothetical protein
MTIENERPTGHERFKELGALANSGSLTDGETAELQAHLKTCWECREARRQYLILSTEVLPLLGGDRRPGQAGHDWDDARTRRKLFSRIRNEQRQSSSDASHLPQVRSRPRLPQLRRVVVGSFARRALAASLVVAVSLGAFWTGRRTQTTSSRTSGSLLTPAGDDRLQDLRTQKESLEELLGAQAKRLLQLQQEGSRREQELANLRSQLRALEDQSNQLGAAKDATEQQLRGASQQRDMLAAKLREVEQAFQNVQAEVVNLRAERDKALLRTASLQSRNDELFAANQDQEQRLKDAEQYLISDQDIRELMGARKLYIADVFDVDSRSRTQRPFGRVFYTQNKSLIFYAFDLDHQPGLKNASAFQVWGRKETAAGEEVRPMNLGILFLDNESKRRWVLRFDDPKQLAEIDAVFVTVEPRGGSAEPTSKPFLYALLRKEVNHP